MPTKHSLLSLGLLLAGLSSVAHAQKAGTPSVQSVRLVSESNVLSNGLLRAGTEISNQAFLDTTDNGGNPSTTPSNTVVATVIPVYGTDITPNTNPANPGQCGQTVITQPGQTATLTYTLTNTGNADEVYNFGTSKPSDTPPGGSTALPAGSFIAYQETNDIKDLQEDDDRLITNNGTGQVTVPASSTITFYITIPIAANTAAGTLIGTAPYAIPVDDSAAGDNNNIGCVTVASELNLDMTQVSAQESNTPDTKTFSHIITNTGNAPLTPDQVAIDEGGTQYPVSYTATYNGYTSPAKTTLQEAVRDVITSSSLASSYPVGTQITTTEVYTIPAGVANGTVNTQSLKPYITTSSDIASGGLINNNLPQSAETDHPDVINITAPGVGTLNKTQANCGSNGICGTTTVMTPIQVKSCDVVQYNLLATNTGPGPLFAPVIQDYVPQDSKGIFVQATSDYPTLYRIDGAAWKPLYSSFTSLENLKSGSLVEIGADVNNDGDITAADQIPANNTFSASLFTQIVGPNCTVPNGIFISGGGGSGSS